MAAKRARRVWWAASIAVIVLATLVLGACSSNDTDDAGGGGDAASGPDAAESRVQEVTESAADGSVAAGIGDLRLPTIGPHVIKRARIGIEVPQNGLQAAIRDATAVAGDHGGFVLSTEVRDMDEGFGTIVLRVPNAEFEAALDEIRKDLGEVRTDRVSGEDVGEEFVDLQARLRNFTSQEAVLLRLMDRATSVVATIRVQRELTDIQLEIERIRGRLRFLEDQTEFATIMANLEEAGAVIASTSTIEKAWENAGSVFLSIVSGAIVFSGALLPVAILAFVGLVAFRLVRPPHRAGAESAEV